MKHTTIKNNKDNQQPQVSRSGAPVDLPSGVNVTEQPRTPSILGYHRGRTSARNKHIPAGIASAIWMTKSIGRLARFGDAYLSAALREVFAISAAAYPVGKWSPAKLDHRLPIIMRTLEVVRPLEAEIIESWLIYVTGLAQDRYMPEHSLAARELIAQIARKYPRRGRWDLVFRRAYRVTRKKQPVNLH